MGTNEGAEAIDSEELSGDVRAEANANIAGAGAHPRQVAGITPHLQEALLRRRSRAWRSQGTPKQYPYLV